MTLTEILYILRFWIILLITTATVLPLTSLIFNNFIDKGYIFSKVLGLLLSSYLVWLLSSLRLLPFSTQTIILVTAIIMTGNYLLVKLVPFKKILIFSRENLKLFMLEELLFLTILIFWSYIRGFAPEINSLEKYMDYGFVNSILKTKFFPPLDMWLSSSAEYPHDTINYYYYGHYIAALLTKISHIPSAINYNLMLSFLAAITFTGVFSLTINLMRQFQTALAKKLKSLYNRRTIFCGLLAAYLVTFGGNLHTIYSLTEGYPIDENLIPPPPWELKWKPPLGYNRDYGVMEIFGFNNYWYPNATRFIPRTIHEFPIYSFVVADLHGHVSDIPFVLLTLAVLFSLLTSDKPAKKEYWKLILLGLLLAVMYMTNAWDAFIYLLLTTIIFLYKSSSVSLATHNTRQPHLANTLTLRLKGIIFQINYPRFLKLIIPVVFLLIVFALPFNRHFIPFAKGIGINCVTPNSSNQVLCDRTPLWMFAIIWGHFLFFSISLLIVLFATPLKSILKNNYSKTMFEKITTADLFVTAMIIISLLLLIAPEFIFARDIYPAHYRANTMFKLGYQAFMMLGIVVAYSTVRFLENPPFSLNTASIFKSLFWVLVAIQLFLVSIYPYFAINSYYNRLENYQTLDGISWLKDKFPGDFAAVNYLRTNIPEFSQPTVLEAVGESYTEYARISAYTGLPTPLGWPVHEWLWRGSYDEPGKREAEVKTIYESQYPSEAAALLNKYKVTYVISGILEHEKYPLLNEDNFYELGRIIFEEGSTRIYELDSQKVKSFLP